MITLRNGSEQGDDLILRSNIVEIRASSVSIMPEDLEKSLSRQDLADVIAYLRGGTQYTSAQDQPPAPGFPCNHYGLPDDGRAARNIGGGGSQAVVSRRS